MFADFGRERLTVLADQVASPPPRALSGTGRLLLRSPHALDWSVMPVGGPQAADTVGSRGTSQILPPGLPPGHSGSADTGRNWVYRRRVGVDLSPFRPAPIGRVTDTLYRGWTVACLLGASGWNGSFGLSVRAACGCDSPTDPPSDGCPIIRERHDS